MIAMLLGLALAGPADEAPDTDVIREVHRGWYVRAGAGSEAFLGRYRRARCPGDRRARCGLSPGTVVGMTFGQDVVDRPRFSAAWELRASLGTFRGPDLDAQPGVPDVDKVPGDVASYAVEAAGEVSTYPTQRLGVGLRGGAGVVRAVDQRARQVIDYSVTAPVAFIGPTVEYYTKLAHFSVGADIEARVAVGLDVTAAAGAWLKYSF